MLRSGKPLATSLVALFLSGCAGDATAPVAPPDPPNRPPVVTGAIPDQRLAGPGATTTLDVAAHFSDPDGDALSYEAASSDTSVVAASAAGGAVTLTGGSVGGTGRVTVIARDPNGAEAHATFGTTVNRLPVLVGQIPIQALVTESPPVELDVSEFFSDPDGDALAFAAASSDASVVAVFVDGTVTVLSAQAIGEAEVTVTARDPEDAEAQATFVVAVTENPDRAALVALYHATDGPSWRQSDNWLTDAPIREWHGVSTADGRVVQLRLHGNDLSGPIPPELGNLASLKYLRLDNNGLTGPLPPELGNLTSLTELWLYNNGLTGSIPPELGNLANLEVLTLQTNPLTGAIPPEFGKLANLKTLSLDYFTDVNGGLTGTIPRELGNLANLEELRLGGNYLSGPIPPELARLASLESLVLWGNALTGPIPSGLGSLVDLEYLFLSDNELTGSIPPELGNLANLKTLALADNALTGPIPPELAKLTELEALSLGGNPGLCAPADPMLRAWLAGRFTAFPCPIDPNVRLLPRALIREDGNGLSLELPDDLRVPSAVNVSDPSVIAVSIADGWLELAPLGRGSAEVAIVPSGGGHPALAGVVVRRGVGTFGIDIVMDQPAPLGYEESMTMAADWWSSALDGTELPDRPARCTNGKGYRAVADDLLIRASSAYVERWALAFAHVCLRGGADSETVSDPRGGKVTVNTAFNSAHDVDVMRHEIGHLLGLVLWPTSTGLVASAGGESYFTGSAAVAEYRAAGGDSSLPGVPIETANHWHKEHVRCELMSGPGPCDRDQLAIDEMDAISLAALVDAGYTVDMSKATPWRRPENAQGDAVGAAGQVINHVVIEWINPPGRPRH